MKSKLSLNAVMRETAQHRKGRHELKASLEVSRAEILMGKAESVWLQAQAVAKAYLAEYERRKKVIESFVGELDAGARGTSNELERLAKRHETAQRKADHARAAYEEQMARAKEAAEALKKFA